MKINNVKFLFLLVAFLLAACLTSKGTDSNKIFRTGVNMLYGEISRHVLFDEYPGWKNKYLEYQPKQDILDSLSLLRRGMEVEIFLGTWCGDSKREVPRFFKIADESNFVSEENIRLWAVDRDKKLESGLASKKNIQKVATFLFLKDGQEIGRIVERPEGESLEEDILNIVKRM